MTHVGRACLVHCIFHVHMTYNGLCCVMLLLTVIVAIDLCISLGQSANLERPECMSKYMCAWLCLFVLCRCMSVFCFRCYYTLHDPYKGIP